MVGSLIPGVTTWPTLLATNGTGRPILASLQERVVIAAERTLAESDYVAPIDVLMGIGWLPPSHVDRWQQGRVPHLEAVLQVNPSKISSALEILRSWARERGLEPTETDYVDRTRHRRQLRFTESGDPGIEVAYRTHWVSSSLSERKRERLEEKMSKPPDLVVVSPLRDWSCHNCDGTGAWLIMEDDEPLCMSCADMDHLVYLPSGDATLTRRARKASSLSAIVVRFSRSRRRYERQGILVEEAALEEAERQCLADTEARARRREREKERRLTEDIDLRDELTAEIARLFPGCPPERAAAIARHTAVRGSGRIGRTAAGRALDPEAVELAVAASIRHVDTEYDDLLMSGVDRLQARRLVKAEVGLVLDEWREG